MNQLVMNEQMLPPLNLDLQETKNLLLINFIRIFEISLKVKNLNYLIVLNENRKLEVLYFKLYQGYLYTFHEQNYFVLGVFYNPEILPSRNLLQTKSNLSEKEIFFLGLGYIDTSFDWIQDGDFRKSNVPLIIKII